jgi:hypothetical protein
MERDMDRRTAERHLESLYGLSPEYILPVIEEMGVAALSDQAVIELATRQLQIEQAKGVELERIAAYQDKHPGTSWETAREAVQHGLR